MKHNGLANLFLGIIYGAVLTYIHTAVKVPFNLGVMLVATIFIWLLTCFLYAVEEV